MVLVCLSGGVGPAVRHHRYVPADNRECVEYSLDIPPAKKGVPGLPPVGAARTPQPRPRGALPRALPLAGAWQPRSGVRCLPVGALQSHPEAVGPRPGPIRALGRGLGLLAGIPVGGWGYV